MQGFLIRPYLFLWAHAQLITLSSNYRSEKLHTEARRMESLSFLLLSNPNLSCLKLNPTCVFRETFSMNNIWVVTGGHWDVSTAFLYLAPGTYLTPNTSIAHRAEVVTSTVFMCSRSTVSPSWRSPGGEETLERESVPSEQTFSNDVLGWLNTFCSSFSNPVEFPNAYFKILCLCASVLFFPLVWFILSLMNIIWLKLYSYF